MSFESPEDHRAQEAQHRAPESSAFALGVSALEVTFTADNSFRIDPVYGSPGGGPGDLANSPGYIPMTVASESVTAHELARLTNTPSDAQRAFFLTTGTHELLQPAPEPRIPEPAPVYKVVGHGRHGFDARAYINQIEQAHNTTFFTTELDPTNADRVLQAEVDAVLGKVCRDLGVNINNIPANYHLFPDKQTYDDALAILGEQPGDDHGTFLPRAGVMLVRNEDPEINAYVSYHERAHSLALRRIWLRPGSDGIRRPVLLTGYRGVGLRNKAMALDEVVDDMLAYRGMISAGREGVGSGYAASALYDAAVWETAEVTHKPAAHVASDLIRGMITGDMAGLRQISKTLGKERTRRLLEVPLDVTYADALRLSHELKLPEAADTIERYNEGKGWQVFDWEHHLR